MLKATRQEEWETNQLLDGSAAGWVGEAGFGGEGDFAFVRAAAEVAAEFTPPAFGTPTTVFTPVKVVVTSSAGGARKIQQQGGGSHGGVQPVGMARLVPAS